MGDRYFIVIKCAYCGEENKDVHYAPTANIDFFKCCKCASPNFIQANFEAKKIEEVNQWDIIEGFRLASNYKWTEEETKKMCNDRLKELQNV